MDITRYEGLVCETARQIVAAGVEVEFEDCAQALRVKVWQALVSFDARKAAAAERLSKPNRGRTAEERYVFLCVMNLRRDFERLRRRYVLSIDELREAVSADRFDGRYLAAEVQLPDEFQLPSSLTPLERQVVSLMMDGARPAQVASALGISHAERNRVLESARTKLADWRPTALEQRVAA